MAATALKTKSSMKSTSEVVVVQPPNILNLQIAIQGTAPYVQHRFSTKTQNEMLQKHIAGGKAKNKKTTAARDIDAEYKAAMHLTSDGKHGIPAPAFRSAMISACRLVGFHMTRAKISVFIPATEFCVDDGTPLIPIEGKPEMNQSHVRLETGVPSISIRPMWREWSCTVPVSYDGDQFSAGDVINLMARAGLQVGIGEGRPDSKKSNGMGWGTFRVVDQ